MAGIDVSPLVTVAAFGAALVAVLGFLTGRLQLPVDPDVGWRDSAWQALRTPVALAAWPLVLLAVAFAASGATNLVWLLVVVAVVYGLAALALTTLRRMHAARGDETVAGPTVATALALLVALEFHWLLVVRLTVVPSPEAPPRDAFAAEALQAGGFGVLLPAVGITGVFLAVTRTARLRRWTVRAPRLAGPLPAVGVVALIVLMFLLPATPVLGGDNQLTFLGLATPEYGKILYFWVLAIVVARFVVTASTTSTALVPWYRDRRLIYPAGLFLFVAAASTARRDLGPLIPVFAGTLGMSWCALRDEAVRRVPPGSDTAQRRQVERITRRVFLRDLRIPVVIILIFLGTAINTDYVQVRMEVARDAWQYVWNYDCDPVDELGAPKEVTETANGAAVCVRRLLPAEASNRSQVAKAGAAVADGGIWGRGLSDTASQLVPLQTTDFVLAAVWNKLGGIVVLGFGALLALLAVALTRAVWWQRRRSDGYSALPPPADRSRLFAAGLAASILGQFAFVLAATLNWVPHSGITAPLLSRGGQSTLALAAGIILALAVAYHDHAPSDVPAVGSARTPPHAPSARGPMVIVLVGVVALLTATLLPYGRYPPNRPLCSADKPLVNPAECSTDLIAYGRTRLEVGLPDGSRFVTNQGGAWRRTTGTGPDPAELAGILTVPGGGPGLAELALPDAFRGAAPVTLSDRLTPHLRSDRPDGLAELTIDPGLQTVATEALAAEASSASVPALAGGLVVLDARSGHILAAASTPATVAVSLPPAGLTDDQANRFIREYERYGLRQPDGSIVVAPDGMCDVRPNIRDNNDRCVRWYLRDERATDRKAVQDAENERYISDGGTGPVPELLERPDQRTNRALARLYQPGSTFKVVVAAAWLRAHPDENAQSMIAAPLRSVLPGGRVIDNFGGNGTPGGVACLPSGAVRITLQMALAVSCNTAFVRLADELGWDAIREMAVDMGFAVDGEPRADTALAATDFALTSVVPRAAEGSAIGNIALGGDALRSTPLQMASVMATIANGGEAVQPTLATELRELGSDETVPVRGTRTNPLSPEVAAELSEALASTASECQGCTARRLVRPDGRTVFVKTGTHVVYAGVDPQDIPRKAFVREYAWLVGFVDPGSGPVSFALVLEAGERDGTGGARAREVLKKVLDAVIEERG
ncbi:MAG: penicillin-binding transpeptidase domain-containing protein [Pseudonocardiaceae bacterium]